MASVSSLDKDMRNIRLSKYTPQAANEVRTWIEDVLGERLVAGDLLEALKDGIALCKYDTPPTSVMKAIKRSQLTAGLPDSSASQPHQAFASKTLQCLSSRWRTFPTSYAHANRLL